MEWDFEACGFNFCCNSSRCCGSGRCRGFSRSLRRAAVHAAGPIVASARSPSPRYFLFMPMCSARMPDGCQGNWGSLVLKIHTGSNPAPSAYQGDRRLGVGMWGVEIARPVPAISPVPGRQQDTSRRAQIFGLCWPPGPHSLVFSIAYASSALVLPPSAIWPSFFGLASLSLRRLRLLEQPHLITQLKTRSSFFFFLLLSSFLLILR